VRLGEMQQALQIQDPQGAMMSVDDALSLQGG
jgi:hypothetical protein